jgi:hypothetical protein
MQVDETHSFRSYSETSIGRLKRPQVGIGGVQNGDAIYYWSDVLGKYEQLPNPHHNFMHMQRDLSVDRVLLAKRFVYFGNKLITMPEWFESLLKTGPGYRVHRSSSVVDNFTSWIYDLLESRNLSWGQIGEPNDSKSSQTEQYA